MATNHDTYNVSREVPTTTQSVQYDKIIVSTLSVGTVVCYFLTFIVIITIIFGNSMVCIAVFKIRTLQALQNRFLVSLAVADLSVGILIMPMGIVNQMLGYWIFGEVLCLIWKVADVLACTASIWNLCLIAIDRYFYITRPIKYVQWRTKRKVHYMILFVWILSVFVSLPPLFGWRSDSPPGTPVKCLISDDTGYILYSTMGSFYIPAVVMLVIYFKIWRAALLRARKSLVKEANYLTRVESLKTNLCDGNVHSDQNGCKIKVKITENTKVGVDSPLKTSPVVNTSSSGKTGETVHISSHHESASVQETMNIQEREKRRLSQARERRATIVLGIIMGSFLLCWYPFFQLYVISALCRTACHIPTLLFDVIFWIGYCNSALNPIIYTIFNRDFEKAFKKILQRAIRCNITYN